MLVINFGFTMGFIITVGIFNLFNGDGKGFLGCTVLVIMVI